MESSDLAAAFGEPLARDARVEPVSFDDFFVVERDVMVRLATSMVDTRERAEEIVQDALEKALLAWQRLDEPGAYLRASVVNGCRSELRRRAPPVSGRPRLFLGTSEARCVSMML